MAKVSWKASAIGSRGTTYTAIGMGEIPIPLAVIEYVLCAKDFAYFLT